MESKDYPLLYQESDALAIKAQRKHFFFVRIKIMLVLAIGGIMSFSLPQESAFQTLIVIVLESLLVLSLAITAILNIKNYDRVWFSSRKIAESVKTETWRFIMKIEPYDDSMRDDEAENRFLERLKEILYSHQPLCYQLIQDSMEGFQITERMRKIRNDSFQNRKTFYIEKRISDQRLWYAKKAKWNRDQESKWLGITWVLEIAAIISAILIAYFKPIIINPIGIFTTAIGGCLSWINARSYREPAKSYGLITHELTLLEERAKKVLVEQELVKIVMDVEAAISREHAIWLGRLS